MKRRNKLLSLLLTGALTVSALSPVAAAQTSELVTSEEKTTVISNDSVAVESQSGSVEVKPNALADDGSAEEVVGVSEAVTGNEEETEIKNTVESLLTPKYKMSLNGSLDITGTGSVNAKYGTSKTRPVGEYNEPIYSNQGFGGQSIDLSEKYGFFMDDVDVADTYTVSFWSKIRKNVSNYGPICFITNSDSSVDANWLSFGGNDSGKLHLWRWNVTDIEAEYELNEWNQYTITVDNGNCTLYKNGISMGMVEGLEDISSATTDIMFGINYWDATPDCLIDEVEIYDMALTQEQVASSYAEKAFIRFGADMSRVEVRAGKTFSLDASIVNGNESMSVEWNSSDEEIATVEDGVITGITPGTVTITATLKNAETEIFKDNISVEILEVSDADKIIADFTFDDEETGFKGGEAVATGSYDLVKHKNGKALKLNGSDQFLTVTKEADNGSLLTGLDEFTVSYDSYSEKTAGTWTFYAAPDSNAQVYQSENYIAAFDATNRLAFANWKNGRQNTSSKEVNAEYSTDTGWKHIDLVVKGNNVREVYVNGVKSASLLSGETTWNATEILGESSILLIGKANWDNGEYFQGEIDNYKIYNYALTEGEIKTESQELLEGQIAKYSFEGSLKDAYSDSAATGRVSGQSTWAPYEGEFSYAEGLEGKSIQLGNYGIELNQNDIGKSFTVSAWVKYEDTVPDNTPVIFLGYNNPENWVGIAGTGSGFKTWAKASNKYTTLTNPVITPGVWQHVVLSGDESGHVKTYINGILAENTEDAALYPLNGENQDIYIGANFWDDEFNGLADEVEVYPTTLSDEEISVKYAEYANVALNTAAEAVSVPDEITVPDKSVLDLSKEIETDLGTVTVTWSSSNADVITNDGVVMRGEEDQNVTLTAELSLGSASKTIFFQTVVKADKVQSIVIYGNPTGEIVIGSTTKLYVNITPANVTNSTVTWTSSNESVASVDEDGLVTAVGEGTAEITATAQDGSGMSAKAVISVAGEESSKFTVTVNNGMIQEPEESADGYQYGTAVTVVADETAPEGQEGYKFSYWENDKGEKVCYSPTYSFKLTKNVTLTARYSADPDADKVFVLTCAGEYVNGLAKFVFTANRAVPAALCSGNQIEKHGILVTKKAEFAGEDALILESVGNDVKCASGETKGLVGTYSVKVNCSDETVYARAYVTYVDKNGVLTTEYSNVVSASRNMTTAIAEP